MAEKVICPTCKQNMNDPPRDGKSGHDCPQCGQGLSKSQWLRIKRGGRELKQKYKRLSLSDVFDKPVAQVRTRTHHSDCWRYHLKCAVFKVRQLETELSALEGVKLT